MFDLNIKLDKVYKLDLIVTFLIVYGILIGIFNLSIIPNIDSFSSYTLKISPIKQLINNSIWYLTVLPFFRIMERYKEVLLNDNLLLKIISIPILAHSLMILLTLNNPIVYSDLIAPIFNITSGYTRYGGIFYDAEFLIDYSIIVLIISMIIFNKNSKISILLGSAAIFCGILSGSRSFIVINIMMLVLLFYFYARAKKYKSVVIFRSAVLLIIIIVGYNFFLKDLTIFNRLSSTVEYFRNSNYNAAFDRDYFSIPSLVPSIPIIGFGNFYFWQFNGNEIVSHNIILAIYIRFGIIGIIIFIIFIINILRYLIYIYKTNTNNKEITLLFILVILLISEQLKLSFIRYYTPIFMYFIIFWYIKQKINNTYSRA
ncbi:MAG: hypothetical protein WCA84_05575 [Ignavibacteriaceae bacterium]